MVRGASHLASDDEAEDIGLALNRSVELIAGVRDLVLAAACSLRGPPTVVSRRRQPGDTRPARPHPAATDRTGQLPRYSINPAGGAAGTDRASGDEDGAKCGAALITKSSAKMSSWHGLWRSTPLPDSSVHPHILVATL